jgi:hypothetical protein
MFVMSRRRRSYGKTYKRSRFDKIKNANPMWDQTSFRFKLLEHVSGLFAT